MTQQMNILDYQPETPEEPAKAAQLEQEIIDADPVLAQTESSSTEIAVIDTSPKNALTIFSNNGLDPLISQIRARVKSEQFDVTTQKGRDRIGSVARQIGSAKQQLIGMADRLTEDAKRQIAAVNFEKTRAQTEFDKLRDEVLAPRVAYLQIEKDRQAEHEKALTVLEGMIEFAYPEQYTVEQIENALAKSSELYTARQWQEYADKANYANLKNKDKLTEAIVKRKEADEAAAEAERVAQAARDKEIEDAKIAAAAQATKDAEDKAAADAKALADQVEADRVAAQKVADDAAKALADKVEADKVAAAAETARIQKAKDDAEAKRVQLIQDNIRMMELPNGYATFSSERVQDYINRHNAFFGEKSEAKSFEELYDKAWATYNETLAKLKARLSAAEAEEQAARDKAIQDQKDRDAKIAKDAADAEAKRIQDAKDAEETARKAREADEANKQRIVDEISFDLMLIQTAPPITKEEAEAVARALIDGKIRNVIVKY